MRDIAPNIKDKLYYQIPQLQDTATYYVRAVVKDLISSSILGTYNLDALGNQAFSKEWTTPPDNTGGNGRTLVITFTVYDDAGYSTPSVNYGAKAEYFRVIQPWNLMVGGSSGWGGVGFGAGDVSKPILEEYVKHRGALSEENKKYHEGLKQEIQNLTEEVSLLRTEVSNILSSADKNSSNKIEALNGSFSHLKKSHEEAMRSMKDVSTLHEKTKSEMSKEMEKKMLEYPAKLGNSFVVALEKKIGELKNEMQNDFNTQMVAFFKLLTETINKMEQKGISINTDDVARAMLVNLKGEKEEKRIGLSDILNR